MTEDLKLALKRNVIEFLCDPARHLEAFEIVHTIAGWPCNRERNVKAEDRAKGLGCGTCVTCWARAVVLPEIRVLRVRRELRSLVELAQSGEVHADDCHDNAPPYATADTWEYIFVNLPDGRRCIRLAWWDTRNGTKVLTRHGEITVFQPTKGQRRDLWFVRFENGEIPQHSFKTMHEAREAVARIIEKRINGLSPKGNA